MGGTREWDQLPVEALHFPKWECPAGLTTYHILSHVQRLTLNASTRLLKMINPKRLWSTIKSLLHSSPPSEQLSPCISQPLANSLATFFCQKIVTLKESISLKLRGSPSPFDFDQPHRNELLSDFMPVTPAEVSKLLQSMSNKSSQLDYIPTSLVKSCADTFSIIISHLANLSFTQATFPSKFKLALISPFLKKPGLPKSEISNFWPILNLNTIGKILERLALARLFPSSYIHISQFLPFAVCLSQIPFDWDRSAQTHKLHHGNYWLWKNHNSDCSRHVCCIWYSWPYHTSPQTSAYFRSVWLCHLMSLLLSD